MAIVDLSAYHARYYAYDLTRRAASGLDRLSMSLFDAAVDLNPHQIEAALFALESPLSKGVVLADEVGLGKTIEAGIVLCQYWAERKRRLLVLCPASIRKQWAQELESKFNLPVTVLDARVYREARRTGRNPLQEQAILIVSFHYGHRIKDQIKAVAWDLVVIDEAHKLRNAYRASNHVGQSLRWATEGCRKILLTATPLQNSLLELYGLASLIDDHLFGDIGAFRSQYASAGADLGELRRRLAGFCKRTLRNQVGEYIQYTQRRPITRPFTPSEDEHQLYEEVSNFLRRPDSYALPERQRHLTALILRKLLASSAPAIAATLDTLRERLESLLDARPAPEIALPQALVEEEELPDELLDEILEGDGEAIVECPAYTPTPPLDRSKLRAEIAELRRLADRARSIGTDTKARALLTALEVGFEQAQAMGAARKALIFTESRRTQEYLKAFLEENGYRGQVVQFNGSNSGSDATAIYEAWRERNRDTGRVTGSRDIDVRTALIEHFQDTAAIMLATEAGAEGVNLQFCSLVINYDLPWNPQRIEQRIGRCHRYGQRYDVVVINFLNQRNEVDRRVLELLAEKFKLFSGIFGASDEVLGVIESGVDFEQRVLAIYQQCRTPAEIEAAFAALQAELDEQIRSRLDETRRVLFEHFDEDVHQRLRLKLNDAQAQLDRLGRRFWSLTRRILGDRARFNDHELSFDLLVSPAEGIPPGRYHLISKTTAAGSDSSDGRNLFLYRLSHPLGEHVLAAGKALATPPAAVVFDVSGHPTRISAVEALRGRSGYLTLTRLLVESYDREEYLLFSGFRDDGQALDQETMEKLFLCSGAMVGLTTIPEREAERLAAEAERHAKATVSRSLEQNSKHFHEAREKLEKWADDMVLAAEKALADTKEQIKALRRQARQAVTLEEQRQIQEKIQKLERQQRRQRQEIFKVEDEIMEKRDRLIDQLEKRLAQRTTWETLFTIQWAVV